MLSASRTESHIVCCLMILLLLMMMMMMMMIVLMLMSCHRLRARVCMSRAPS